MNNRERIIDLKALCRGILGKWRLLLIFALIGALVMGGLEGYSQYKAYQKSRDQAGTDQEASEEKSASKAEELKLIGDMLDQRNAYFTGSIMSRIDPAKEGMASADLIVRFNVTNTGAEGSAQNTEGTAQGTEAQSTEGAAQNAQAEAGTDEARAQAAEIVLSDGQSVKVYANDTIGLTKSLNALSFYGSYATVRSDLTEAARALNETPESLRELITVTDSNKNDYMVTLKVIYPTQEGARQILDTLIPQLEDLHAEADSIYGAHSFTIANVSSGVVVDANQIKWANSRVTEINALANARKSLDKNIAAGSSSSGAVEISKKDVLTASAKKAVTGLAAGLIGAAVLIALWLLMTGKVLSARELNRQYGLYRIACVPVRKYSALKGIDKLVAGIDAQYYNHTKRDTCMQVADANMQGIMRGSAQIALISDLPLEYIKKVAGELNKAGKANNSGMRYFAVSGAEQTADTVQVIDRCDAAVLVARAGSSTYKGVADVLDMADLLDRKAAGSIVFM